MLGSKRRNPYHLLKAGQYDLAMREYQRQLAISPNDEVLLDGYPFACLCLGRLEEALEGFLKSNELTRRRPIGEKQPYLMHIGVVQWLLGRREEALGTFRTGVDGILNGTIQFADLAGGAKQGLLLWYAGVTVKDDNARMHAISFMERLTNNEFRIDCWPGPLAAYAVGAISLRALFCKAFGIHISPLTRVRAMFSGLVATDLAWIQFYMAVKCREGGDEDNCLRLMRECTRLKQGNPILEWHLAKAEVEKSSAHM